MAQHYKTNQVVPAADDGSSYPTPCMRPTAKRATFANGGANGGVVPTRVASDKSGSVSGTLPVVEGRAAGSAVGTYASDVTLNRTTGSLQISDGGSDGAAISFSGKGASTVLTPGGTIRPAGLRGSLGTNHNLARTPYQSSVGFLTLQDLLDFPTNPDTYKHNLRARILVGQEDLLDIHGRWDEFGGVVRPVSPINSVAALGPAFDRDPNRLDITKEQIDQGLERLSATWLDLLLWSVLMGEMGLAWEFWRKCSEPLRAAILAARTCRYAQGDNQAMLSDSEEQELLENANTLEGWACGLLDQIKKEDEAMKLISHVPHVKMRTRRCADNGHLEFEMWEGSTLDEAIQEQFECKAFVGHRHCQRLIKATFNGNYPRSKLCLKVDEAKHIGDHLMLFIRIMTTIFLIIPFTLGAGVGWLVKLDTPDAWPVKGKDGEEEDDDDDGDSDDEWDTDYLDNDGIQEAKERMMGYFGKLEHFFRIPKVKFYFHSFSSIVYITIFTMQLIGTPSAQFWLTHDGIMPGGYIGALEVINWAWTVLRLYEEIKQATKQSVQAYINADNVVDLLTYTMIMAVAVMRLLVFFDCRGPPSELWANRDPAMDAGYWNVFYDNPDRMKLLYYSCPVAPGPNGNGWLGLGDETWWWARMYGTCRYDLLKSSALIYALAAILSYSAAGDARRERERRRAQDHHGPDDQTRRHLVVHAHVAHHRRILGRLPDLGARQHPQPEVGAPPLLARVVGPPGRR